MSRFLLYILIAALPETLSAQELFPLSEPASTMPGKTLGVKAFVQGYQEVNTYTRYMTMLRLMYGITPKLTVMLDATGSNHHSKLLPPDFPDHNTPQVGVKLPYLFNGVHAYAKYRFLSIDGEKKHLRVAAYAEYSYLNVAHDEAEPNLLDDTKGFGGGVIGTYLHNKFAVSGTAGLIFPSQYQGDVPDFIPGLPGIPATVKYGRALAYSVSFGYRILPLKYKNYDQLNLNLYCEFLGKAYEKARVYFDNIGQPGTPYEITGTGMQALAKGHYIEMHPGLQLIVKSNLRIDMSVGFPVYSKSYAHFYPMYTIGIQRYFYF